MSTWFTRTSSIRTLVVLAVGVIIAGCLDSAVTGPENASGTSFAARLIVLDGNSQSGPVNRALPTPIKLRVTDVNGSAVEGATVSLSIRQGGGSVNPPTVRSGADGTVSASWTLGTTMGSQKVVAVLTGQWVVDSATLTATATNGAAAKLAVDAGDNQRATIGAALPSALSVLVTDDFGNPVPGAEVSFRVASGGGRVDALRSTTDASGKISATWTLGTAAGTQSAVASLANGTSTSFRASADAGSPTQIILESGATQAGTVGRALASPLSVRVVDAFGNNVRGASVSWVAEDGSISPITPATDSLGRSQARWTLGNRTGTQNASASVSGAPGLSLVAVAQPGAATSVSLESGDRQTATVRQTIPLPLVARLLDSFGNGIAGVPVTWAAATGGGALLGTAAVTDAFGRATALWTLGAPAGSQMATLAISGLPLTVYTATAVVASGDSLAIEAGNGQTGSASAALGTPLLVRVRDLAGNPISGASVVFSIASGSGSVSLSVVPTDVNGRASTVWTLGSAFGVQTATATSGTRTVTFSATAQPGAPATVTLETGDRQTQTVRQTLPLPLVARILDATNHGVPGVAVNWTAASGGGTLLATSAVSDATGRATAYWTLGASSGSQLATMGVIGLPLTVFSATATAAVGDSVVIEAGNNQTGVVGTPLGTPLIVRVRDRNGNPSVGTTVIFSATSGGGGIQPSVVVTDANGRASASWTLGSFVGAQTASATIGSLTLNFVATGSSLGGGGGGGGALTPAQLVLVSGNGQNGTVGQTLGSPIVLQVIDASGIPVSGVNVTWTLAAGNIGGFASPAISRTDGNGNASLLWTLGSKVGLQQVTASVVGVTSVTLQASALIGSSGAVLIDNGNGQVAAPGAVLPTRPRVLVVDQSGTPVVGARVIWSTAVGNGTLSKASGLTDASGLDDVVWTLGATVGSQQLTATVTGLAPVTFNATATTGVQTSTPTTIVKISGDGQVGRSATQLGAPLIVEVRDANGVPLSGVQVLFTQAATNTDGYVSPSPTTTDARGQVSVQWTLGSNITNAVKTNTVTATLPAYPAVTGSSFTAMARPQFRMRYVRGTSSAAHCIAAIGVACPQGLQVDTTGATLKPQSVGDARTDTLVVQVYDPTDSTGVQGVTVTWATQASDVSDGRPVNSVLTTDNFGFAKNVWLLRSNTGAAITPSAIAKRMIAAATGIGEVEFQVRVFNGRLVGMNITAAATNLHADSSNTVGVKMVDVSGYGIPGVAVTFAVSAGGGTASPAAVTTNSDGTAVVAWKFGPAGGANSLTVTGTTAATGPYGGVGPLTWFIPYGVNFP